MTSDLLACSLCLGFWAGLLAAFVAYLRHDITLLALPLATSISAWLFEAVIDLLHTLELTLEEFRSRFRSER